MNKTAGRGLCLDLRELGQVIGQELVTLKAFHIHQSLADIHTCTSKTQYRNYPFLFFDDNFRWHISVAKHLTTLNGQAGRQAGGERGGCNQQIYIYCILP